MEKKRSVGVTIFGLLFIVSVFSLAISFKMLFLKESEINLNKIFPLGLINSIAQYRLIYTYGIIQNILHVVAGILILRLDEIGRKITLWISGVGLLYALISCIRLIVNRRLLPAIGLSLPFMIIPIIIIFFFTRPKVKEQFR